MQTADAASYVNELTTAGALFVGPYSPEAIGDYTAGPSHVLPTSGNARFANGLSVNDFLRTNSVIHLEAETFLANAEAAEVLAAEEALDAHRQSVAERRKGLTHA